jgi:hypothetical protein
VSGFAGGRSDRGVGALATGLVRQDLDGGLVERDDAVAGSALGLGDDERAVDVGDLLGEGEAVLLEVDVGPPESYPWTAATA